MEAERREPKPERAGNLRQLGKMGVRVRSGAPDSSNCPPGSSEMDAPLCGPVPFRPMGLPSSMIGSHAYPAMPSSIARIPFGS